MKGTRALIASFLTLAALQAVAQRDQPGRQPGDGERPQRRPGQPDPQRSRPGPWNRDLHILRSRDGTTFGESKVFVERGGVPCLTQDAKGRLIAVFQWFPMDRREDFDRIGVVFSEDNGRNWSAPRAVEFQELPPEYERQFDPTLVTLEDGRVRLYFTSNPGRDHTSIYSAISTDAVHFTFEPGQRFGASEENVVDCSVAKLGEIWHLFAPLPRQEGRAYHATSKDGLKFERQADVTARVNGTWIGNVLNTDGGLKFYGSGRGVWSAVSRDGATWEPADDTGTPGGDPAVWRLKEGDYIMVVTGALRTDAPMDPPWRRDLAGAAGRERLDALAGGASRPRLADLTTPAAGTVAVTANGEFVYVVRDGVLYQFGARDLNFLKQTNIPESPRRGRQPGTRPPDEGDPRRPVQPR